MTTETRRYQAWITVDFQDISTPARYSKREAREDADELFERYDGKYRAVVLDLDHYSVGSLSSCVYLLTPNED